MSKIPVVAGTAAALLFCCLQAQANPASINIPFEFSYGTTISGSGTLIIEPNTSPADPNPNCATTPGISCRSDPPSAYRITSITGTFSDTSIAGLSNVAITGLVPTDPANERDPGFDPAVPASLSFVGGTTATPPDYFSYDNLFYLSGAPIVCDFPFTGTYLDPFGVAFTVYGGDTVALWGDGDLYGPGSQVYGVGVLSASAPYSQLVNVFSGVSASFSNVPEPGSAWVFAAGLLLLMLFPMGSGALRRKRGATPRA